MERSDRIVFKDTYSEEFSFTQHSVNKFLNIINDTNPLHYSKEYSKETKFGKPILPGLLSISIFSKIFGNNLLFPKAILVSIDFKFLKPMYADENYKAEIIFDSTLGKHKAKILTKIYDTKTDNLTVVGLAVIKSEIIF